MNISSQIDDLRLAYWGAYLISLHTDDQPNPGILPEVSQLAGPCTQRITVDPSDNLGRGTIFLCGRYIVVLQNGVTSAADGQRFLAQYAVPFRNAMAPVWHPNVVTRSTQLFDRMAEHIRENDTTIMMFGHSAGGAALMRLQDLIRRTGPLGSEVKLITFGSPRPGNHQACRTLTGLTYMRYFADSDFVPFVPPHRDESLAVRVLVASETLDSWDTYTHPRAGTQIDRNGGVRAAFLPPPDAIGPLVAFLGAALSNQALANVDHTTSAYMRLFQRFMERPIPPVPLVEAPVGPAPEPPQPDLIAPFDLRQPLPQPQNISERELQRRLELAASVRFRLNRRRKPYIVSRVGRRFYVVNDKTIIAYFRLRRRATRLAKSLNASYFAYLRRGTGDPSVLGDNVSGVFSTPE